MEKCSTVDRFLICGMGSLGQYCLFHLKRFAVKNYDLHIVGIDRQYPEDWEIDSHQHLLEEELILGDSRKESVLLKAGVQDCRAILITTDDETANVEAAISARRLNPKIRLVVRSSRPRLNRLLEKQLGNFVALEPTKLAAAAFTLEGLGSSIRGVVDLEHHQLQIVEQVISKGDRRFDQLTADQIHQRSHRFISGVLNPDKQRPNLWVDGPSETFHRVAPELVLEAGDRITYIELVPPTKPLRPKKLRFALASLPQQLLTASSHPRLQWKRLRRWLQDQPTRQVISFGLCLALTLSIIGAVSLKLALPHLSWQQAVSTAMILLLGGYGDVFGGLENLSVPLWLQMISLLITLISLAFVFGALGLLAERLISSRFAILRRKPIIPEQNHAIVIGLGRVGQCITQELKRFRQPTVAISVKSEQASSELLIPVLFGNPVQLLEQVNLETAKSIIVVTDDQLLNLELALTVQEVIKLSAEQSSSATRSSSQPGLVVRTFDQNFSENLSKLLPDIKVLTVYEIAAEAFAGAAFGEDVLALFRLREQTILVTEYQIAQGDTLLGKTLAQIAYGYGVMPIFHRRAQQPAFQEIGDGLMPADSVLLKEGDRLVVLASINGLRRIEHGEAFPSQRWQLSMQKPLNPEFLHSGGNTLARVGGLELEQARAFMRTLPNKIELALYPYQAANLQRELEKQLTIELKVQ